MLDDTLLSQLKTYLGRVSQPFTLVASLDDSAMAQELRGLLVDIAELSNKVTLREDGQLDAAQVHAVAALAAAPRAYPAVHPRIGKLRLIAARVTAARGDCAAALPELVIDGKTINGWIGVLRKGGRKFGGFSLFQNGRQIQGFPNAWKPKSIFGGVDDEGANNLVAQRLTGVLQLDGFVVSHTKDAILFEGDEEDKLEQYLVTETKAYADYAKSRRGSRGGQKWSKDQVRDLIKSMQGEFTSSEIKDALNNAALPPPETLDANNQQQLMSLTAEDEIGRLEILPDLEVVISLKETSQWEPHVTFVPGAEASVLHVIINGLHPYYQTLEAKDSINECVQQYIFDAVAEFKASKLVARVNPDSVRRLKNDLLRARADQMANADAEVRTRAEVDLFDEKNDRASGRD